jgi:hypothetical protein
LRPLGLSEKSIAALCTSVAETAAENVGTPVAFQMLECMVEFMSEHSLPSECCAICRGHFSAPEHVLVTSCEHFLHPWCTKDYARHVSGGGVGGNGSGGERGGGSEAPTAALCPVCRTALDLSELCDRAAALDASGGAHSDGDDSDGTTAEVLSAVWRTAEVVAAQAERERVRARQAEKGGLISAKVEILIRETLEIATTADFSVSVDVESLLPAGPAPRPAAEGMAPAAVAVEAPAAAPTS